MLFSDQKSGSLLLSKRGNDFEGPFSAFTEGAANREARLHRRPGKTRQRRSGKWGNGGQESTSQSKMPTLRGRNWRNSTSSEDKSFSSLPLCVSRQFESGTRPPQFSPFRMPGGCLRQAIQIRSCLTWDLKQVGVNLFEILRLISVLGLISVLLLLPYRPIAVFGMRPCMRATETNRLCLCCLCCEPRDYYSHCCNYPVGPLLMCISLPLLAVVLVYTRAIVSI